MNNQTFLVLSSLVVNNGLLQAPQAPEKVGLARQAMALKMPWA
jgi:hypothetical protein